MNAWGKTAFLSRSEQKEIQNSKLHKFINEYVYPFSPFYRALFDRHKIDPKKIRKIEDLKRLPFTSKQDFIDPGNPLKLKEFILQPDEEKIRRFWPIPKLIKMQLSGLINGSKSVKEQLGREFRPCFITFTTGTSTNNPISYLYTSHDIDNLRVSGGRMLQLFEIDPADRIVNMFPYAPHLAFWQVVFGGLGASALILSTGGGKVMGTEGNISALQKMKPSVILGVPSYVYHVLREARKKNCKMDFLKKIVLGASKCTVEFKEKLAGLAASMGAAGVSVFGTYGFTESRSAWAECPTENGISSGYHLYPEKEIFEIIDPETGEVKGEGEDGELVFSSIDARGSVVIRYRTGDYCVGGITCEPCPHCGRTVARIRSDITRLSDQKNFQYSKVKGSLVNFNNFESTLSGFPDIDEWQIEISKKDNDPYEVDQLVVYLAPKEGADKERLEREVRDKLLTATEVSPNEVKFLSFQDIVKCLELETSNKEKRILDRRPKE